MQSITKKYPFKFLDAYNKEDQPIFFGRENEIEELYKMVFESNLMLVYGASGTGKTSIIRCGLVNKFKSSQWHDLYIRRGENLNVSLLENILKAVEQTHNKQEEVDDLDWFEDLVDAEEVENVEALQKNDLQNYSSKAEEIGEALNQLYLQNFKPIYLILDQFEEIFTIGREEEQQEFAEILKYIITLELPVKTILVMREEYFGRLYELERVVPELRKKRIRLEQMTVSQIEKVIRSATAANTDSCITLAENEQSAIINAIIDNIREGHINIKLPYLQVYIDRLHEEARIDKNNRDEEVVFTLDLIEQVGEIKEVLNNFIEKQSDQVYLSLKQIPKYKDLPEELVWTVLSAFATLDGTKVPIRSTELHKIAKENDIREYFGTVSAQMDFVKTCIHKLNQYRVLRYRSDDKTYELLHDTLAKEVAEKRSEDKKTLLRVKRLLESYTFQGAAQELLSKKQLNYIEAPIKKLNLSTAEKQLIKNSYKAVKKQKAIKEALQKDKIRRTRRYLALSSGIAVVALIAGIIAFSLFRAVGKESQKTNEALKQTNELSITNQKLLNVLEFYDDKFALAHSNKRYGFINKKGRVLIEYKYTKAEQFDRIGFARVEDGEHEYLIDTLGIEYRVAYNLNSLKADTEALDLRNAGLKKFPKAILDYTQLKILILNHNQITTIPDEINELVNLKNLQIAHCQIRDIPPLDQLSSLKILQLNNNNIEKIEGVEKLKQLRELHLGYNSIEKIEGLEKLTELRLLRLHNNKIEQIEGLSKLKKLTYLYLYNNNIKKIEGISALKKMQHLSLSNNKIQQIEGLKKLVQLKNLSLHSNPISEIKGLNQLKKLETLYLHNDSIRKIENINELVKLKYLYLNGNKIEKIEGIEELSQLQTLYLNHNKIKKIEGVENLVELKILRLDKNELVKIEGLEKLTKLQEVNLSENKIAKIEGLKKLTKLQDLYLYKNNIEKIEGVEKLSQLQGLYLYENDIKKIEGLENLIYLHILDLYKNKISVVENLIALNKLQDLYLSDNPIHSSDGLMHFTNLDLLDLNNIQLLDSKDYFKLKDALPNCKIIFDFSANANKLMEAKYYDEAYDFQKYAVRIDSFNYTSWFNLSFYALFVKKPDVAINAAQKTLSLNRTAYGVESNLALGYLLNNQYEKAEEIYLKRKEERYPDPDPNNQFDLWKDVFLDDIKALKNANITHPDFEKAIKLLQQE